MKDNFFNAIENRRSIYNIGADSAVPEQKILEVIEHAVKYVPSAFHSQSQRAVVLFGESHKKLWSITLEALRKIVPAEGFAQTKEKIESFAAGHATVLFFDDTPVTDSLAAQFPLYKDNFPVWALQANGMLQFAIWAALENEGLGASLQHYNPLIDEAVKEAFSLPQGWKLLAQMPFGTPLSLPQDKEFMPIEQRLKVFH